MFSIGPIQLDTGLILAPMAGSTDLPTRTLFKQFGAELAVSEMVTTQQQLWHTAKSRLRLEIKSEPGPVSMQILGADPKALAEAAKHCADQGAHIIDINMGCPAKKVLQVASGSAILRDEALVKNIVEAVVDSVDIPVTLKIRTGWDKDNINALNVAHIAESSGIQMLTIHGRTRADKFNGHAEYATIKQVKQHINIPVVANGDITSLEKAIAVKKLTNADALMIGRAAIGNPWLFSQIQHFLKTGETLDQPSEQEIYTIMMQHLDALHIFYGDIQGPRIARKHVAAYLNKLSSLGYIQADLALEYRQRFNRMDSSSDQIRGVQTLLDNALKVA